MRKVSQLAATALLNNQTFFLNNTRVDYDRYCNELVMRLHDNSIACWQYSSLSLSVSLAGFNTVTTRERLNTLLNLAGYTCRIVQRKGEAVLISTKDPKKKPLAYLRNRHWYTLDQLAQFEEENLCL